MATFRIKSREVGDSGMRSVSVCGPSGVCLQGAMYEKEWEQFQSILMPSSSADFTIHEELKPLSEVASVQPEQS